MIVDQGGVLVTPECLGVAERDLLEGSGSTAALWCGRAATGLYAAYRVAAAAGDAVGGAEVILPSIACATVANAALLAGLRPRFADVDGETGLLTLDGVRARWTPRTRAVVHVHLFGQVADLEQLAEWCRERDVLLIEDAAQALGGRFADDRPVGSVGDMAVYSFNQSKILECGGGLLTARRADLLRLWECDLRRHPLPPEPDEESTALLASSYRNLHHSLVALFRLGFDTGIDVAFRRLRPVYDALYLRRMCDPAALARSWPDLRPALARRLEKADFYARHLANGPWRLLDGWRQSGVCWRYSLLVDFPRRTVAFSEAVRRDGFHVSNLYWSLHSFFAPEEECPAAEGFARRIINLWVDDSVGPDWVLRCAESMRRHAATYSAEEQRS